LAFARFGSFLVLLFFESLEDDAILDVGLLLFGQTFLRALSMMVLYMATSFESFRHAIPRPSFVEHVGKSAVVTTRTRHVSCFETIESFLFFVLFVWNLAFVVVRMRLHTVFPRTSFEFEGWYSRDVKKFRRGIMMQESNEVMMFQRGNLE